MKLKINSFKNCAKKKFQVLMDSIANARMKKSETKLTKKNWVVEKN